MGMVGRYIDALAAAGEWEAVDAVLEAQLWGTSDLVTASGGRCLIGHAIEYDRKHCEPTAMICGAQYLGDTFDYLCERYGMERVVRLIKARAGKHTRPNIEQPLQAAYTEAYK